MKELNNCPQCGKPTADKFGDGGAFGLVHGQWECRECYVKTHPECPKCKKLNYATAKFCQHCGSQLPTPAKEPWQMTREEFIAQAKAKLTKKPSVEFESNATIAQRSQITKAFAEGKPVPPEVLKDYPNLRKPVQSPPSPLSSESKPAIVGSLPIQNN